MPNYQRPYAEVFKEYTRYLIGKTKDLRLLTLSPFLQLYPHFASGQPSWVVDFRYRSFSLPEPMVSHTGTFSPNRERLNVEVVYTSKIIAFFPNTRNKNESGMEQFYNKLIVAAAKITNRPVTTFWQTWLVDWLYNFSGAAADAAARLSQARTVEEFLHSVSGRSLETAQNMSVKILFNTQRFALLDNETVKKCVVLIEEDADMTTYQAWALKGATQRYVVVKDSLENFRYKGWLEEAITKSELNSDFFSTRTVERITFL